jgi:DNA-binding transcriptional LysR family regulator
MSNSSRKENEKFPGRRFFKELRFRQLRALVETARLGGFAEAARKLGTSTPSVWRQVRSLEDQYAVQLVKVSGHEVRLTEDGELLLSLATPLVEGFDSLPKVFTDRQGTMDRVLRLAAPSTMLNSSLCIPISNYQRSRPNVRMQIIDAPSRDCCSLLALDKVDVAIVGRLPEIDRSSQFEVIPMATLPFLVAGLSSHPFTKIKNPKLQDVVCHPLILAGEASSSRIQFEQVAAKAGLSDQLNVRITANHVGLMLNYVLLGMGLSIVTSAALEAALLTAAQKKRLVLRDLSQVLGHEEIVLLYHRGRYEASHMQEFRESVVSSL